MKIKKLLTYSLFLVSQTVLGQTKNDTVKMNDDSLTDIIPVFTTNSDLLGSGDQAQNINSLLQSSRDVFVAAAGFNFSAARYKFRGYSSENTSVILGGMPVNDPESGWAIWSYWGGLNDVVRYPEVQNGLSSSHVTFGGIGGYSNISMRASDKRAGSRFSYASTNRTYRNRVMFTHNTGWKNGWAFSASVSARWSQEGYVQGTFYNGVSYFLAAERKLSKNHTLNFATFAAPYTQGRQGLAQAEAYKLTGNNYYNPYWGYQTSSDGSQQIMRNSRVRNNFVPYAMLTDYLKINEKSEIQTTLYAVVGRTGNTGLNWFEAANPRPNYYRYLPSYYTSLQQPDVAQQLTNNWQNDINTQQINWDQLYFANSKNLYTVEDANGITGNTVTGNRSKYVVQDYRVDPRRFGIYSVYKNDISDKLYFSGGINAYTHTSHNYALMDDLLGGDYWVDINQFALRDATDQVVGQNDLSSTNKLIKVGDTCYYNYDMHVNHVETFGNLDIKLKKIDAYIAASISETSFWRHGNWQNGVFPENSYGDSKHNNFFNYGIKGGVVYKISGRHFITANGLYETRAPFAKSAYVSPRTRGLTVPGMKSTEIISGDINYEVRYSGFKMRLTGFYSQINNQIWARRYYNNEYQNFVNYMMNGVNQLNTGVELGIEKTLFQTWVIQGAFTTAQYIYTSRPTASIVVNNATEFIEEGKTIYLKNYHVGGMPQTAATLGLKYNSPKYWYVGANFNYFADMYLPINPDRRSESAVSMYVDTDPGVKDVLAQEKLPNGYLINVYGGKSWRMKNNDYIRLNVNINNVLNNTKFVTGGYEQLRYVSTQINKFPPMYAYAYGLTYFAMVSYLF